MQTFAGIDLKALSTKNIFTMQKMRRAIDQHIQTAIAVLEASHNTLAAVREIKDLHQQELNMIGHLDNYVRMEGHVARLADAQLSFPRSPKSLNGLVALAVKCMPNDWTIQSELRTLEMAIKHVAELVDSGLELTEEELDFYVELEEHARDVYIRATQKNFALAYEKFIRVTQMSEHVRNEEVLPLVLGLQIYHYLGMLSYLDLCVCDNAEMQRLTVDVCLELDKSVSSLLAIPEEVAAKNVTCLSGLKFFMWGRRAKNDYKTEDNVAPGLRNRKMA